MSHATDKDAADLPEDDVGGEYYGEGDAFEEEVVLVSSDFISGPFLSEECTIKDHIIQLDHSYGYDCKRLYNLVAPDENTLVFASGNLIHFYNVNNKKLWFRRSYLGGGIGHITSNPMMEYPHLTVAENGDNPPIIIYDWPSMDIVAVLKGGAAKRYSHINYSPDGELLVSQSYAPDFLITVWNWKKWRKSPIVLRIKSHVHDVYKVMFSPYVPGHITTGGSGHIKFWKMANTFTGLKLQGELGRFGKTEITDIIGIFPMPDEKVISGSEWGNLLVWEAGLIKIEVFRTMRRNCHNGPIMQLVYIRNKSEIWSISQDGWLRAWNYKLIDEADPPDDDRVVQLIPSYEREVVNVQFMSLYKKKKSDPEDTIYYAQDGNGGIWTVDLILRADYVTAKRVIRCHAGPIVDMAVCPWGSYIISLGDDGNIQIYNYYLRRLLNYWEFGAKGRVLMWLPLDMDPTGQFVISAFDDGVIRVLTIQIRSDDQISCNIVQSIKPHNKPVNLVTINPAQNLLVSAGEDKTIFLFQLLSENDVIRLNPIGFIYVGSIVTCFTWNPAYETSLLLGCIHGQLYEYDLPKEPLSYTKISYLIRNVKPKSQRFTTCKAQIRRDLYLAEVQKRKDEKLSKKRENLEQMKINNPGVEIDEEIFLMDSESEEVLEPLHIPEIPNRVLFAKYTSDDTIWISMGGYDAGYIYEYRMDQTVPEPLKATIIEDGDDIEMTGYLYSHDGNYILTNMNNGGIRVNRINPEEFRDLSDYWLLYMHDNFNGQINRMCFSWDHKYFFSCGNDGNVFAYKYQPEEGVEHFEPIKLKPLTPLKPIAVDENYKSLSLEETMIKAEEDLQLHLANEHKRKLRARLTQLTHKLDSLLARNCELPKSQRYTLRQFIIDDRIMKALDDTVEAKVALERRKLAYDVEKSTVALKKLKKHYIDCLDVFPIVVQCINTNLKVSTYPQKGLKTKFYDLYMLVQRRAMEEKLKGRMPDRVEVEADIKTDLVKRVYELEPFLVGLSPSTISFKMGAKLSRLLRKYRARKRRKEIRLEEWDELNAIKPIPGVNHPEDERALLEAINTIGDFKLKTAPGYKKPENQRESTVTKYQDLLAARLYAHKTLVHSYNMRVYALREKKVKMVEKLHELKNRLDQIHEELPDDRILEAPQIPVITDADFPEKELEMNLNVEKDYKKVKKQEVIATQKKKHIFQKVDAERSMLLGEDKLPDYQGTSEDIIRFSMENITDKINALDIQTQMVRDDRKPNAWEKEYIARRLVHKLFEQDDVIFEMNNLINTWDKEVIEVRNSCYHMRFDATFMDIHLLVLNQELLIVKEFESVEDGLRVTSLAKLNDMLDMRDFMKRIELNIDVRQKQIQNNIEQIKDIQQMFNTAAKDNKFWDFLRRIFKKKYKPPRVQLQDGEESSSFSSESSSESEEDDAASLDSRELGPIRLDESVCPKGCDKELYDHTFVLRSKRHALERAIQDEKKGIEMLRKDLEMNAKRMRALDQASKKALSDLEEYQHLKQTKLNEVLCTVILSLNQLQHIEEESKNVKLTDVLVFDAPVLTNLYKRVGELQNETIDQRARHKKNKKHLHRMNVDTRFMATQIKELKTHIVEAMYIKFGRKIDIDDLEEAILKRMVLELRLAMLNMKSAYDKQLFELNNIFAEKQIELKNTIRENTARLEVLAILNQEKSQLTKYLYQQAQKIDKFQKKEEPFFLQDIEKLESVVKSQLEQIEILKHEIKLLSTKSLPAKQSLSHERPERLPPLEESRRDAALDDFGSLDDEYLGPEKELKVTKYLEEKEELVTEEDIFACVKELGKEIVTEICKSNLKPKELIVNILSELIEQIPIKYFHEENTLDYFSNTIKTVVPKQSRAIIDQQNVIEQVTKITQRSIEDVTAVTDKVLNKVFDQDKH